MPSRKARSNAAVRVRRRRSKPISSSRGRALRAVEGDRSVVEAALHDTASKAFEGRNDRALAGAWTMLAGLQPAGSPEALRWAADAEAVLRRRRTLSGTTGEPESGGAQADRR